MKTGITGATGQLGKLVVESLKDKVAATDLVALVRTTEKAADLAIEARTFDYANPDTLVPALADIDHLLLISSNEIGQRAAQHANVIAAAKEAGVKWIVYTSLLHADTSTISLAAEHLATEQVLIASGIPFTILRNGWYSENYLGSLAGALQTGAFTGSAGDGKISAATRQDFADAAVAVLTSEGHQGASYELAGDEAHTLADLAAEVSRQTGKDIAYQNLPEGDYAELLKGFGLPEHLAGAIASWDTSVSKGDLYDTERQLSTLIGRPTTPLSDAVKAALA